MASQKIIRNLLDHLNSFNVMYSTVVARHKFEYLYLLLGIIALGLIIYFFYEFEPLWTVIGLVVALLYIRLLQGQYLGNALEVNNKHFFRLKQIISNQSKMLNVPEPKLFISQDPYPNAYTLGFKNPYSVILTSSLVEGLTEEELESVIAHEMGHVKYHHARISSIITPTGNNIPVFSLIFGFWNRASETSADNIALSITENPRALITSLTKMGIGINFLNQIDEDELLTQSKEIKRSLFNKAGELLNTHPYLTSRIHNIINRSKEIGIFYAKTGKMYCPNCRKSISISSRYCIKCGFSIRSGIEFYN
jgi:Zn-dependent protease with chaperone function